MLYSCFASRHFARRATSAAVVPRLWFSTKPLSDPLRQLQKQLWETYLASGRGGDYLFSAINKDSTGKLTASEVNAFLQAVPYDGTVREEAFQALANLAEDHEISSQEFLRWLVTATKFSNCSPDLAEPGDYYHTHPSVGARSVSREDPPYSWNKDTMAQNVRRMEYAVRGKIVMRAEELKSQGREIIFTNIGNPHAVGQHPLTYNRQVMALCDLPAEVGVDHPYADKIFPKDVLAKAREYREAIGPAGTGAYTHSQGLSLFRQNVADFIEDRDGHPAYPGDIFLTNGASSAIQMILTTIIASDKDAIMIPIPQYPIYSALIALLGGRQVGYELDESIGWAATGEELNTRLLESHAQGLKVKAMAIINPGNPTGQVLNRESLETICKFCADNEIVLLADEVYQRNVYDPNMEFLSAKKVAVETPGCEHLQLISFHSTSKGLIGECGRRGGYMELHNIDPYVHAQLYKLASSGLCSCVPGQIMMSLMVQPPQPGDDSYPQFHEEENGIFESLRRRANALVQGLNKIDGIECQPTQGAMYAFPSVKMPPKAIEAAKEKGQTPDLFYAMSLLEETGICVVPASGFGQKKGRHGFRTTFLPPEDKLMGAIDEFGRHHKLFCEKYA
mmetsp:Transcript_7657/g.14004  ORF Transcript_7657/g.14004 Transcript_7657/m.14004 type:complete len:621 (+) Transcript_7657:221-2083(+)